MCSYDCMLISRVLHISCLSLFAVSFDFFTKIGRLVRFIVAAYCLFIEQISKSYLMFLFIILYVCMPLYLYLIS